MLQNIYRLTTINFIYQIMGDLASVLYLSSALITTLLTMAKFNGGFFGRWEFVFSPLTGSLALGTLVALWGLYSNRSK